MNEEQLKKFFNKEMDLEIFTEKEKEVRLDISHILEKLEVPSELTEVAKQRLSEELRVVIEDLEGLKDKTQGMAINSHISDILEDFYEYCEISYRLINDPESVTKEDMDFLSDFTGSNEAFLRPNLMSSAYWQMQKEKDEE
jgi:hypothetical protein